MADTPVWKRVKSLDEAVKELRKLDVAFRQQAEHLNVEKISYANLLKQRNDLQAEYNKINLERRGIENKTQALEEENGCLRDTIWNMSAAIACMSIPAKNKKTAGWE